MNLEMRSSLHLMPFTATGHLRQRCASCVRKGHALYRGDGRQVLTATAGLWRSSQAAPRANYRGDPENRLC
jgi:adenosylmethionine-8-amino-7-oxononanoate aminotransferase